jgi:hypothetical protein
MSWLNHPDAIPITMGLGWVWEQLWPNLVANIVWAIPLAWLQHRRLKHHNSTMVDKLFDRIKSETEDRP